MGARGLTSLETTSAMGRGGKKPKFIGRGNTIGEAAKRVRYAVIGCWLFLCGISLNHLTFRLAMPFLSPPLMGAVFLFTLILTVLYIGKSHLKTIAVVFCGFFLLNALPGPFLEPPGDPLDHIRSSYERLKTDPSKIQKTNHGYWHYSGTAFLLKVFSGFEKGAAKIRILHIIHGIYCGLLGTCIFLLGINAGLPVKWALLSSGIAFAFLGTHKFSYFGYYSFGPSFSSILIYWIWITVFFISNNISLKAFSTGTIAGLIFIPILLVNHVQEAIFLGFVMIICGFWAINNKIASLNRPRIYRYGFFFVVLFVLPQFEFFQDMISQFFIIDDWEKNQSHVFSVGPFHLTGKIWKYRVHDTLGILGILPVLFLFVLFFPGVRKYLIEKDVKVWILGVLPILVYCIPLFHFIWLSNCEWKATHVRYYYRICYASFFWLTLAYAGYRFEPLVREWLYKVSRVFPGRSMFIYVLTRRLLFAVIVVCILGLGMMRRPPVYGKLDFIYINTAPWWPSMKSIVESIDKTDKRRVLTDPVTSNVLSSVFNIKVVPTYRRPGKRKYIDIQKLDTPKIGRKYQVIINLKGFPHTWVPVETGHWNYKSATTSNYYLFSGKRGPKIIPMVKEYKPKHIRIFL